MKAYTAWFNWFAWWPVLTVEGQWVWLLPVQCRLAIDYAGASHHGDVDQTYEYRITNYAGC